MKSILPVLFLIIILSGCSKSLKPDPRIVDKTNHYLREMNVLLEAKNGETWGFQLNGPTMFVDQATRMAYANETGEGLHATKNIYTAILPDNIVLADRQIKWNEKNWNLFVLPLPNDSTERQKLIIKQLFRNYESNLGLDKVQTPDCNHLNQRENRIWMKIEAEALKTALSTNDITAQKEHIRMALAARKMRQMQTKEYFIRENNLDLKEGLPELAWLLMNGSDTETNSQYLIDKLEVLIQSENFMRYFGEVILPAYGFLMSRESTSWLKSINNKTDNTRMIEEFYQFKYPEDFLEIRKRLIQQYNGTQFEKSEDIREQHMAELALKYEEKIVQSAFIMIRINPNTAIKFDTNQLIPLKNKGTIYLDLNVSDQWGTVNVTDGALINTQMSYIYLAGPFQQSGLKVSGPDWQMNLNSGYTIKPYMDSDKFIVAKE